MQLELYAIRDSKGEVYSPPFLAKNEGEAIRALDQQVRNPNSMVNQFPEDYHLYHLGTFDDTTGKISANDAPTHKTAAVDRKQVQ